MRKRKRLRGLIGLLIVILLVGCSGANSQEEKSSDKQTTDYKRIISTSPTCTEILVGLGLGEQLIAADTYSGEIEGVGESVELLDLTNPDMETIMALTPDLVVTSSINLVGSSENPFKVLEEAKIKVVYVEDAKRLEEIYATIHSLGEVTGQQERAKAITQDMEQSMNELYEVAAAIPEEAYKTVYFEISPAPYLYTFGTDTFLSEILTGLHINNIFANEIGWFSPSEEAIINGNPDVIITNCGYMEQPVEEILSRSAWENISALQTKSVYLVDENSSSRASQNVVLAAKEIAKAVYPEYYE